MRRITEQFRVLLRRAACNRRLAVAVFGIAVFGVASVLASAARATAPKPLVVCSDPDNMPFSNAKGEGFENRLAVIVAAQLGRPLAYDWLPQRPDLVREELAAGRCDMVIGVPTQSDWLKPTQPYYWSSYVLISRADRKLDITSLKDHRLRHLKIGVASVGVNDLYSPPAHVLAGLGLAKQLIGYQIDGEANRITERGRIVDAVVHGDIDIAALWEPLAGYFVQRQPVKLNVIPVGDTDEFSSRKTHFELLGLQYEISMGVRQGNETLFRQLDRVIEHEHPAIAALLASFGVPLIAPARFYAIAPTNGEAPD